MLTLLCPTGSSSVLIAAANAPMLSNRAMASSRAQITSGFSSVMASGACLTNHDRDSERNTNVMQSRGAITLVKTLAERVAWARNRLDLKQDQLAAKAGVSQGTIGNIESGARKKPRDLVAIATALGVRPEWLASGTGQALAADAPPRQMGEAHDMSQFRPTVSLPKVAWEDLKMGAKPDQPFELDVIDDALAPEIFKGCVAIMDPARPPEPAWPVLVRDRFGGVHLRDYELGPGGTWSAVARAPGFKPLHSEEHGLKLLAAMDGYKRPRKG